MVAISLPIISLMVFLPIVASVFAYLIGRRSDRAVRIFALLISVVILGLAVFSYASILISNSGDKMSFEEGPFPWIPTFKGVDYHVGMDGLGAPLVLVSAFLTVLVVLGSWELITTRQPLYYTLILLFEGAIIGVFTSLNLLLFYFFWESVLIPMFFFIGIWGGPRRKYAAMKFFLFTYVASIIMLLGFLVLYISYAPTFDLLELEKLSQITQIPLALQTIVSVATFVGFGVKLPVVPFHTWLPDAHTEAPAPISVFLAGVLLKMGGYGFIRVNLTILHDASVTYGWIFMAIGLITMFYGAVVAMTQKDLKRLIALTSVNHMGFVLLGAFTMNVYGVSGAIFQMFNHAAAVGVLFMLTGYIHEQTGTREIQLLKGMKVKMPKTATLVILGSMAGMGVPIFSPFLSEYMVILGAISVNTGLAVAMLIPVITVGYFLWMLKRTVLSQPDERSLHYHDMKNFDVVHLTIYLIPLLLLLIFPSLMLNMTNLFAEGLHLVR
ncbi:MAG: NADH-quinone oxidoreductase subunit M [Thaumarchaeota archaeon]|nr:NADH-quinone oxidoreductase subunit M [Nitrososphaerota archaeon]MCL5316996.1 NADH-quinone oxidoreductase subunit M [Nitrososphaerota archaeon]